MSTARILVVDDNPTNLKLVSDVLTKCRVASEARKAWEKGGKGKKTGPDSTANHAKSAKRAGICANTSLLASFAYFAGQTVGIVPQITAILIKTALVLTQTVMVLI